MRNLWTVLDLITFDHFVMQEEDKCSSSSSKSIGQVRVNYKIFIDLLKAA